MRGLLASCLGATGHAVPMVRGRTLHEVHVPEEVLAARQVVTRFCDRCRLTCVACTCGSVAAKFEAVQRENERLWGENVGLHETISRARRIVRALQEEKDRHGG